MNKGPKRYEGKAKIIFETDEPDLLVQEFKDSATAFDGTKKGQIAQKGFYNNQISQKLFTFLAENGIETHFVKGLSEREMLVRDVAIFQVEVVVRNVAAGSLVKRIGLEEGLHLNPPIVEFYYKNDALHDPLINRDHVRALNLATMDELNVLADQALRINHNLKAFMAERDLQLVDFKLEFGRYQDRIILADEISPDTCRLWDRVEGTKLDKDRFRFDLGNVEDAYQEVYRRVCQSG